ncbi:MAG: DUF488 family protein [Candidatus Limnocylindrales bacterium]
MTIRLKRVYEPRSDGDGYRVLVDRLWPRGLTKDAANIDLWLRDIAPSTDLRTWYGHELARWPEFQQRYEQELLERGQLLDLLRDIEQHNELVTLLFAARDQDHNEANVLADALARWPRHVHH